MEKIILKERKLEMVCTFNIKTAFMQEILNVKKLTSGGTGDTLATILAIIVIIFIIIRFIDISYRKNILEEALGLYIPETLTEWENRNIRVAGRDSRKRMFFTIIHDDSIDSDLITYMYLYAIAANLYFEKKGLRYRGRCTELIPEDVKHLPLVEELMQKDAVIFDKILQKENPELEKVPHVFVHKHTRKGREKDEKHKCN